MRERLSYYINQDETNHIAIIVDFDGPDGIVIVDGLKDLIITGREDQSGVHLFIGKGWIFGEPKPDVRFIHQGLN